MSAEYFLKIDTIEGESEKKGFEKQLEIQSFSWAESQAGSSDMGTGGGTGKVSMGDFNFVIPISKASPKLFLACATGQAIKSAEFSARKAGGKQEAYLKWKFSDLLISSFQSSGSGETPTDSFSFNFSKIEVEYKPQNADGSLGAAVTAGYDLKIMDKV
jgi:type VI secretion system secreted protein Hcp